MLHSIVPSAFMQDKPDQGILLKSHSAGYCGNDIVYKYRCCPNLTFSRPHIYEIMHLQTILIAALSAFVCAQSGPNPIVPLPPSIQAGVANTVSWAPNTPGTVSLQLRWGSAGNLVQGIPIASQWGHTKKMK